MRGLAMTTTGWDGGSLDVDVDGDIETFTVAAPDNNVLDVAEALCAWVLDAARAWTGKVSAATWDLVGADGYLALSVTLTAGGYSWDMFPSGTWGELLGHPADPSATLGTVDGDWLLQTWTRWSPDRGLSSRSASVRAMHPKYTCRRPRLEAYLDPAQHLALTAAIRAASTPRRARVWQPIAEAWRDVAVGAISFDTDTPSWTKVGLEALG